MADKQAQVLDIFQMSIEEKLTALAFQGLANRGGAKIWCRARFWNWPGADDFWMGYFGEKKGFGFQQVASLPELIKLNPGVARGLVVWDPKIDQTKWIAMIYAGLKDLLPVAPECISRYGDLPIVEDLRGKFTKDMDAAQWSADNLTSECRKDMAYSIERTWSGATIDSLDYAVQQKQFVYCLDHGGKKPGHVPLAHQILTDIGPNAGIFGWGEPEDAYCDAISFHDNYVVCAEAPNLSFWTNVPCQRTDWKQPARRADSFKLENKHYIAICTSEGDTPKMAVSVQGESWLDPNRGKVKVNWGMNPIQFKWFPALLEFYWDSATENDYFVGGASGAGYTYPTKMPNPNEWMEQTGEYFAKADMHETEAWMHFSRPVYDLYAELSSLRAFILPCGPYGVSLLNDGEAVAFFRGNSGLNYFDAAGTPKQLAEQIKGNCWKHNAPTFSTVLLVPDSRNNPTAQGGWNPTLLVELREILGEEFELVTIQELTELAIQALKDGRTPDCFSAGYSEWEDVRKNK